jgi:hypothetical protein
VAMPTGSTDDAHEDLSHERSRLVTDNDARAPAGRSCYQLP